MKLNEHPFMSPSPFCGSIFMLAISCDRRFYLIDDNRCMESDKQIIIEEVVVAIIFMIMLVVMICISFG